MYIKNRPTLTILFVVSLRCYLTGKPNRYVSFNALPHSGFHLRGEAHFQWVQIGNLRIFTEM